MATQRLRSLRKEIYKTLNQLNPGFMFNIFQLSSSNRATPKQQVLNLEAIKPNQVNFGKKKLRGKGPKIWENPPPHIKFAENLSTFESLIKSWDGVSCQCNLSKAFVK